MHRYAQEHTLTEKLKMSLKVHGPIKTFRFLAIKFLLPVYKLIFATQSFDFAGKKIRYFFHNYNNTWDNERGVEIAIFNELLKKRLSTKKKILEVGHVLGHYIENADSWDVLDKFENAPGVINEDIADYSPGKKYDYIFSISTMEHVGYDDDQVETKKADKAIDNVKELLSERGVFIMSDPIGYNKELDKKIFENKYGFQKIVFMKREGYREWNEVEKEEVMESTYDAPYSAANALAICFYYTKGKAKILDIGCGLHKVSPDAIGMDIAKLDGVDIVHDLEKFPYPFKDNELDEVHANMVLEHLSDFEGAMREVHRILEPGGRLYIKVPFYATTIAFQDYTHKNYFSEKTFSYFTKDNELSYYQDFYFKIIFQELVSNSNSGLERIRNLIPFRKYLKFILWNMYDELHVVLEKE